MPAEAPQLPFRPQAVQVRYSNHGRIPLQRLAGIRTLVLVFFAFVPTAWAPEVTDSLVSGSMAANAAVIADQQLSSEPTMVRGNEELISPVGGFYEPEDLDRNGGMFDLTTNYYAHMSSPGMHVTPTNPWDLGINPYVPDRIENWYYGRTPDGSGGAWANEGNIWTYWSPTGDLIATYRSTFAGDPAIVREATFNTSSTYTIDLGFWKYVHESGGTTTVYLRPDK
jgi:hypothetical protein